jgi:hypothetical protein
MANENRYTDAISAPQLSPGQYKSSLPGPLIDCTRTPLLAAQTVGAFIVPAGAFVSRVGLKVTVVEGGAALLDVGDLADPNGFIGGADANALTIDWSKAADAYGEGQYFGVETILLVTTSANLSNAKFFVWADLTVPQAQPISV